MNDRHRTACTYVSSCALCCILLSGCGSEPDAPGETSSAAESRAVASLGSSLGERRVLDPDFKVDIRQGGAAVYSSKNPIDRQCEPTTHDWFAPAEWTNISLAFNLLGYAPSRPTGLAVCKSGMWFRAPDDQWVDVNSVAVVPFASVQQLTDQIPQQEQTQEKLGWMNQKISCIYTIQRMDPNDETIVLEQMTATQVHGGLAYGVCHSEATCTQAGANGFPGCHYTPPPGWIERIDLRTWQPIAGACTAWPYGGCDGKEAKFPPPPNAT